MRSSATVCAGEQANGGIRVRLNHGRGLAHLDDSHPAFCSSSGLGALLALIPAGTQQKRVGGGFEGLSRLRGWVGRGRACAG